MTLIAKNISKKYGDRYVVKNVSIEIKKGEIIGLLGPNGAGKTTTFYMLVGLVNPMKGSVLLNNENISKSPMYIRARKGLSYLAQEPSVFRKLSVEDNIYAILEYSGNTKKQNKLILEELLHDFGLESIRRTRGDLLSEVKEEELKLLDL